ncbi:hypothetical protein KIN20_012630 [Parelaphostrongylus tenuis]|uniref:Uncharacterized protein n=1 Tax=Parelaphostrongylus tenuis TaxID=148309 RepID=A0AAD5MWH9_PARTN|nr:hypothetical protein KIN20_012630 [Parelaphostrongylus tenuis]
MYKEAKRDGNVCDFSLFCAILCGKVTDASAQLFDGYYVLVRMLPHSSIRYDISVMPCFLFLMDWRSCEILAVYQEVMRSATALREMHVALIGMAVSEKL